MNRITRKITPGLKDNRSYYLNLIDKWEQNGR